MPFDVDDFIAVFACHNTAIWPLQIITYAAGAVCLRLLFSRLRCAAPAILLILSVMWVVNCVGNRAIFFAPVNPVAFAFAGLFVIGAGLLALAAVKWRGMFFQPLKDIK